MLQHALLFAITAILAIAMITFGGPFLLEQINEKMADSNSTLSLSGSELGSSDPTTVDLGLGSAASSNDFMKDFCASLAANKQAVQISC